MFIIACSPRDSWIWVLARNVERIVGAGTGEWFFAGMEDECWFSAGIFFLCTGTTITSQWVHNYGRSPFCSLLTVRKTGRLFILQDPELSRTRGKNNLVMPSVSLRWLIFSLLQPHSEREWGAVVCRSGGGWCAAIGCVPLPWLPSCANETRNMPVYTWYSQNLQHTFGSQQRMTFVLVSPMTA